MRSFWSPTAARCCSSAITETRGRSTSGRRRTTAGGSQGQRDQDGLPGAIHQSAGYGRSTYEETDFHQQEEDRWIKDAAEELKERALRNDYDALAVVAPPKALGVLRKCLHKEVEKRLLCTINKEMSGRPVPDIEALLDGETRVELPNA